MADSAYSLRTMDENGFMAFEQILLDNGRQNCQPRANTLTEAIAKIGIHAKPWLGAWCLVLAGCVNAPPAPEQPSTPSLSESQIVRETHDFGLALARPSDVLVHRFQFEWHGSGLPSADRVRIPRPCCTKVQFVRDAGAVWVEVECKPLSHGHQRWLAGVLPENGEGASYEYVLAADVLPRFMADGFSGKDRIALRPGESRSIQMNVSLHHQESETPGLLQLNCEATPEVSAVVTSTGDAKETLGNGVVRRPHALRITIRAGQEPGIRQSSFQAVWADLGESFPVPVVWEVVSPVRLEPKAIVLKDADGESSGTFVLGTEGEPFTLQRVHMPPGIRLEVEVDLEKVVRRQTVRVYAADASTKPGLYSVAFVTDKGTLTGDVLVPRASQR